MISNRLKFRPCADIQQYNISFSMRFQALMSQQFICCNDMFVVLCVRLY